MTPSQIQLSDAEPRLVFDDALLLDAGQPLLGAEQLGSPLRLAAGSSYPMPLHADVAA